MMAPQAAGQRAKVSYPLMRSLAGPLPELTTEETGVRFGRTQPSMFRNLDANG